MKRIPKTPKCVLVFALCLVLFSSCKKIGFENAEHLDNPKFLNSPAGLQAAFEILDKDGIFYEIFDSAEELKSNLLADSYLKGDGNSIRKVVAGDYLNRYITSHRAPIESLTQKIATKYLFIGYLNGESKQYLVNKMYDKWINRKFNNNNNRKMQSALDQCAQDYNTKIYRCDRNYYVTYSFCLAGGILFTPASAVLCVGGATAVMINCYNDAEADRVTCVKRASTVIQSQ